MKKLICFLISCSVVLCISSCVGDGRGVFQNYDLSDVTDSMDFNLSEIVEDMRAVPLETDSSFFLKGLKILVGSKYIVTLNEDAIHLFDAVTGKHIRKLAVKGRGPNEYTYIYSGILDEAGNMFYLSQQMSRTILGIDLLTGEFRNLKSPVKMDVDLMLVSPEGNIYTNNDSLMFAVLDTKTGRMSGMIDSLNIPEKKSPVNFPFPMWESIGGVSLVSNYDDVFLYSKTYNDTVYRFVPPAGIRKEFSLTHREQFADDKGIFLALPFVSDEYIFCRPCEIKLMKEKGMIYGVQSKSKAVYAINRRDGKSAVVRKFIADDLGGLEMPAMMTKYGGMFIGKEIFALAMNAYQVKDGIEKVLEKRKLTGSRRKYLEELNGRLTEESNPVVFIGTRKK